MFLSLDSWLSIWIKINDNLVLMMYYWFFSLQPLSIQIIQSSKGSIISMIPIVIDNLLLKSKLLLIDWSLWWCKTVEIFFRENLLYSHRVEFWKKWWRGSACIKVIWTLVLTYLFILVINLHKELTYRVRNRFANVCLLFRCDQELQLRRYWGGQKIEMKKILF